HRPTPMITAMPSDPNALRRALKSPPQFRDVAVGRPPRRSAWSSGRCTQECLCLMSMSPACRSGAELAVQVAAADAGRGYQAVQADEDALDVATALDLRPRSVRKSPTASVNP